MQTTARLHFDSFELQPAERRLMVAGRAAEVGSRAFDVLLVLAERAGRLVSKNELLALVWPNVVVEENNVQVQISTLRKLLGPQAIATIPGRGYRLTAAPEWPQVAQPGAHPVRADAFGGVPAASRPPHAEVAQPAPLIGRDAELAELHALVLREPLVTVAGPGGIGKTRLALACADAMREAFPDGVHVVELAPLVDQALVPATLGMALGLSPAQGGAAIATVVSALAGERKLIVLDNCEHVLDAVNATISALRKGAPTVHLLATSQELLRHPDEHVYRLAPLAVPSVTTLATAADAGAVELFVSRARAVEPRFALTEANVGAVVEICWRLDGIPLAIELAAARVPLLGVEGVRNRLDDRFRLLTAGSRMALRRHQTLRAALEWSYGLLSPPEQIVLERLGVFAGSFSLESAQQLAQDDDTDEWTVLDHLGALVDRSLLVVDGADSPRYRLLETTRAFALERLAERGATMAAMRRHAEVVLALCERSYRTGHDHSGTSPLHAAKELAPERDNLRGALRWAGSADGDPQLAVALLGAAHYPMFFLFSRDEGWTLCRMIKPLIDDATDPALAARARCTSAMIGLQIAPLEAAQDAEMAVVFYRHSGDRLMECAALRALAIALAQGGRIAEALEAIEMLLAQRDPAWPRWMHSCIDNSAALILPNGGDIGRARRHAEAFLEACRALGHEDDEVTALSILVDLDVVEGRNEQAAQTAQAAISHFSSVRPRLNDALNLRILATALMINGHLDEAETIYRQALAHCRRTFGNGALVLYDAATLLLRRGRLDDAARVWAYAAEAFATAGRRPRLAAQRLDQGLLAAFAAAQSPDDLARLYQEGRRLTDEAACELAFPLPVDRSAILI